MPPRTSPRCPPWLWGRHGGAPSSGRSPSPCRGESAPHRGRAVATHPDSRVGSLKNTAQLDYGRGGEAFTGRSDRASGRESAAWRQNACMGTDGCARRGCGTADADATEPRGVRAGIAAAASIRRGLPGAPRTTCVSASPCACCSDAGDDDTVGTAAATSGPPTAAATSAPAIAVVALPSPSPEDASAAAEGVAVSCVDGGRGASPAAVRRCREAAPSWSARAASVTAGSMRASLATGLRAPVPAADCVNSAGASEDRGLPPGAGGSSVDRSTGSSAGTSDATESRDDSVRSVSTVLVTGALRDCRGRWLRSTGGAPPMSARRRTASLTASGSIGGSRPEDRVPARAGPPGVRKPAPSGRASSMLSS